MDEQTGEKYISFGSRVPFWNLALLTSGKAVTGADA